MKFDISKKRQDLSDEIKNLDALEFINDLDCPGNFIYSQFNSRISVKTENDFHAAKHVLEKHFACEFIENVKFASGGDIIVTFIGEHLVPVELWIEATPHSFPEEILGNCHLKPVTVTTEEYVIACDAE